MIKVLGGVQYSTVTAQRLAWWSNGLLESNLSYCSETLFQTKTGKYFLHCEGGALSQYGVCNNALPDWGEQILPLVRKQAQAWAIRRVDTDTYERIFHLVRNPSGKLVMLTVKVPEEIRATLIYMKVQTGRRINTLLGEAIIAYSQQLERQTCGGLRDGEALISFDDYVQKKTGTGIYGLFESASTEEEKESAKVSLYQLLDDYTQEEQPSAEQLENAAYQIRERGVDREFTLEEME